MRSLVVDIINQDFNQCLRRSGRSALINGFYKEFICITFFSIKIFQCFDITLWKKFKIRLFMHIKKNVIFDHVWLVHRGHKPLFVYFFPPFPWTFLKNSEGNKKAEGDFFSKYGFNIWLVYCCIIEI